MRKVGGTLSSPQPDPQSSQERRSRLIFHGDLRIRDCGGIISIACAVSTEGSFEPTGDHGRKLWLVFVNRPPVHTQLPGVQGVYRNSEKDELGFATALSFRPVAIVCFPCDLTFLQPPSPTLFGRLVPCIEYSHGLEGVGLSSWSVPDGFDISGAPPSPTLCGRLVPCMLAWA